ncbi:hypothetical protein KAX02_09840 [candidate division WOR-3 bacterium]|nr:hypothetical protein [candidate division WOR-3 bacterium]
MKNIFVFVLLGTFILVSSLMFASELYVSFDNFYPIFTSEIYVSYELYPRKPYPESYPKNDEISLRIRGINKHLAGIVSDTITDMLWNPARLPSKSFISFRVPNRIVTSLPGPLKTRLGILLEGSYSESENKYREKEPSYYYWDYHYTDYLNSHSSSHSGNTYKGVLLGSKQVNPNTCIGLRLDYSLKPNTSSDDWIYRYTRERNYDSYERLDSRDDIREYNGADTTSSWSLGIGILSSIRKSDVEIVLMYRNQKELGHFLDSRRENGYGEYIRTYDSTTYTDIHNFESERLAEEYDFLNPQIWSLGMRLSRDITPTSTFRTIATLYKGYGDAQRERKNLRYYYEDRYYSYSDPDTFYAHGDTSESYQEDESVLEGDANILGGLLALGQEFSVSPKLSGGVGIRISYEKSEVKLTGTRDEVYDTLTSHSAIEEKSIGRKTYVYLPMGIEYRPIPEIAVRFGISIYGFHHLLEENTSEGYSKSKYTNGPYYNISFGAGYNWKRFKFDIYTMDVAAIKSWEIELCYSL